MVKLTIYMVSLVLRDNNYLIQNMSQNNFAQASKKRAWATWRDVRARMHAHMQAQLIKAFDPLNKVSVLYLLRFLRNIVLKLMPWCQ